ncbi:MAG TPA: NRDE family protein [Acidimicrobiales bacterium]|nr:NRDE family protein [Acidimicrobiales bacterium]
MIVLSRVAADAPLVVGANRDERLERPAVPMAVLRGAGPRILGGRDEEAGGTWLAVNEHGVFAGLTNRPLPEGRDPAKRSRGALPLLLTGARTAAEAVADAERTVDPSAYNPAWLLVGDRDDLYALDLSRGPHLHVTPLQPGVHVLENQAIDEPSDKAAHVRALLGADLESLAAADRRRRIRTVLADHVPAVSEENGSVRPAFTTAACVHADHYGTRWSGLVEVPSERDAPPFFAFADGPPCRSPWGDAAALWRAEGASG